MTDKIKNYYSKLSNSETNKPKLDKNYKQHYILPCSMILALGGTGSGKTNALISFLERKTAAFYKIIIYSGSTTDEPLYEMLKKQGGESVKLYTDIKDLPELSSYDSDKQYEKLIVFDDFINLNVKEMRKIKEYLVAGRKFNFTVFCMAQNYKEVPKTITRNINYFIIFRLNDNVSINNIIRNHNIDNIDKEEFKNAYVRATEQPMNFFLLDLKNPDKRLRYRQNFLNFIQLQ